ncbi:DUF3108 domain-containing protein [Pseudorhodoplanes sinuspersici]|uniref:Uncharacterized protein n=1 Tax=Pseudorhodoplanes sinuspersici TaxID=1235591 RepID=A0A1W6ZMY0_9HYPH|nr:DUF3108 domain-containing protein [Pseudorhodoplanes sinuspersici]ARP98763.1 hypothetical protein CAK95_06505 [Pseudorhodoplanes sinuspersici]RKE69624.1 uncharacterized protein DUF3108 [Pseudorhodoplanes sinuspersici]
MRLALIRTCCGPASLILALACIASPAYAQGQFDARYTLSVNSFPLGKFTWRAQISASEYSANAVGRASGIFSMLLSGEGTVSVKGIVKDGRLQSSSYVSAFTRDKEKAGVTMLVDAGRVRDLKIDETDPDMDRIPVTDAHKQDIADPLTALLIPAPSGDPVAATGCERKLSIFDGRRRFDLALSFRRNDKAMPEKGYTGPALVCAVKFTPIAGHRASSPLLTFLIEGRDIEIWFVPVSGTRVLAPVRLSIASGIGTMLLRADQFETATGLASGRL